MEKVDFLRKQYITVPDAHILNLNLLLILLNHCRGGVWKRIFQFMMQGLEIYQSVARYQRRGMNRDLCQRMEQPVSISPHETKLPNKMSIL